MVYCQAFGCRNRSGKGAKCSFYRIPDPEKRPEISKKWVAALKVEKYNKPSYKITRCDVVCSEHFTEDCFEKNVIELPGKVTPKRLKLDAVPSIFLHHAPQPKVRESTEKRLARIEAQKYIQTVLAAPTSGNDDQTFQSNIQSTRTCTSAFASPAPSTHSHPTNDELRETAEKLHTPSFLSKPTQSYPGRGKRELTSDEELTPSFPIKGQLSLQSRPRKKRRRGSKKKMCSDKERTFQSSDTSTQTCLEDIDDNGLREKSTQWPPDFDAINIDHNYPQTQLPVVWPCCAKSKLNSKAQGSSPLTEPSMAMPPPPPPSQSPSRTPPTAPGPPLPSVTVTTSQESVSSRPPPESELHAQPSEILTPLLSPKNSSMSDESSSDEQTSSQDSSSSTSFYNTGTSSDPSYVPSDEESSSSEPEDEPPQLRYVKEKKFLVFEECLDTLLYSQKCAKCGSGQICEIKKYCVGTMLVADLTCFCGNIFKWSSQPKIGKQPVGNLLTASAILLSGKTYEQVRFFAELLNLQFISHTTFNSIQNAALLPTINHFYEENISSVKEEVKNRNDKVVLCGDGRCDSPGYNAKYCTYTFIDMKSHKILDMSVVQVTEATSSVAMEKIGCQRTLEKIIQDGIDVATVATDRHTGIRKMLRELYPYIIHQFDVWHLTKSIGKRLITKSKQKGCSELSQWTQAINNHIWWAAQHCRGDPELIIEMIQSITHHICNIHHWNSCDLYHNCAHREFTEEEIEARKWFVPGSKAHTALQEVLFDTRLVKDMRHLTQACHTGSIEAYHNLYLKYAPKRLHFKYPAMLGRSQLAVLDHNHNVEAKQATVKCPRRGTAPKGSLRYRYVFSKHTKEWIRKKVPEDKDYTYLWEVMVAVLEMKMGEFLPEDPIIPHLPENIAPVPRPPRAEIDSRATTRFTS
ncbi:uncharacterized protein LOC121426873 [Lytechinus variegatus]|uniref:uncharacterized protein LOC121426873 n=1 Tax=Lytechinus variegatus TaxID=7654 RepID=UPI001BB26E91|nr:uncharacterized protein LOC121426873 [Lytechinus variegatus]